jgi:hypothetical protein
MKNTARQIEGIKNQTIGVEVEMNNITRETQQPSLPPTYFGTGRFKNTADINGYYTWSAWDAQGREWKFQRDVSIAGPDAEKCEMVTPILHLRRHRAPAGPHQKLRQAGARASPDKRLRNPHATSARRDTHRRAFGTSPTSWQATSSSSSEPSGLTRPNWAATAAPVDPDFLAALNKKKPQTMAGLADIWYTTQGASYGRNQHYNSSRYHMLNLHATFTKGTVEFRLFNAPADGKQNGLHAGQLKTYIQLCLGMSALAKEVRTASARPQQSENPRYAMRTWLLRLGFIGDEFKTSKGPPDTQEALRRHCLSETAEQPLEGDGSN